jgi:peptidoglycan/xylan/chitin deacetylase (PgdA/CDA1 family)
MRETGIPVLMYHGIISHEDDIGNPIHISKVDFEKQMIWLYENKYQIITIAEMLQFIQRRRIPQKSVVLTFDDGYESLLTNATPILEKFKFSATIFLLTGAVGKKTYAEFNTQQIAFPDNDRPLSWSQLRTMEDSGWDVQSHSHNHYIHNIISESALEKEMRNSKDEIEYNLQRKVAFYCYPFGSYNTKCLQLLKTVGYKAAFSVHPGMAKDNSDIRRLPRIEINRYTDLDCFKRKVETGFDGNLNKLKSSFKYAVYKNTRLKDALKYIYDLRK